MLNFFILIAAGLIGAVTGWLACPFVVQAGIEPALAQVPLARLAMPEIDAREFAGGFGLVICIALATFVSRRRGGWVVSRGMLATIVAGGVLYGVSEASGALFDSIGVNPLAPAFEFEIRLPAGSETPMPREDIQIELHTDRNQIIAALSEMVRDNDRPVLRGSVPLKFRTAQRQLVMSLPGEPVRVFRIRLPAQPQTSAKFGAWQQVDFIEDARSESRRAEVTADYAIRYRVK